MRNWRGLAFLGMEEEGILGRWRRLGVGSVLNLGKWRVVGNLVEPVCLHWNWAGEEEGTEEVG